MLIFRKKGEGDVEFDCFKGIGSVAVTAEVALSCLMDKTQRIKYDPLCKKCTTVKEVRAAPNYFFFFTHPVRS